MEVGHEPSITSGWDTPPQSTTANMTEHETLIINSQQSLRKRTVERFPGRTPAICGPRSPADGVLPHCAKLPGTVD
jgi:hypothetical protein